MLPMRFRGWAVGAAGASLPYSLRRSATSTSGAPAPPSAGSGEEDVITPWHVSSRGPKGIDYARVREQFQSQPMTAAILDRLHATTLRVAEANGQTAPALHRFFSRGIAFSHRDLETVLADIEATLPQQQTEQAPSLPTTPASSSNRRAGFYMYTGRGPSSTTMHIGHMLPFLLCKYLQDAFHCPFVIQMTDDEKFLFRDLPLQKMHDITTANIKDIIAFGFDPAKTFIFRNTEYMGAMYPTILELQRLLTCNAVKNTFGFGDSDSVGKYAFAATQAAPAFVSAFPDVLPLKSAKLKCLIPCAIDQDPFFVLTRSVCDRLKRPKPALLHTTFLPALKGATAKMSSSAEQHGTIFLTDPDDVVRKKMRSSFSGGQATLAALRELGADLEADVAFQYLRYFLDDDAQLAHVGAEYKTGRLSSGAVKDLAADVLCCLLADWRVRRAAVTDETVAAFCQRRNILR